MLRKKRGQSLENDLHQSGAFWKIIAALFRRCRRSRTSWLAQHPTIGQKNFAGLLIHHVQTQPFRVPHNEGANFIQPIAIKAKTKNGRLGFTVERTITPRPLRFGQLLGLWRTNAWKERRQALGKLNKFWILARRRIVQLTQQLISRLNTGRCRATLGLLPNLQNLTH